MGLSGGGLPTNEERGLYMVTSKVGIELIKRYEGVRLVAYKPVSTEVYWTIGYGHYGADVTKGMVITLDRAEELLKADLRKFEKAVDKYVTKLGLNQNQYDALVSFAFNCGAGNLDKLVGYGFRSLSEISEKFLVYNKAGGKVLAGLTRRRKEERALFDTPSSYINDTPINDVPKGSAPNYGIGKYEITASSLCVRYGAGVDCLRKKKSELTADGQKHSNDNGGLLKGTRVTVNKVAYNGDYVWGLIPSGWICLHYKNTPYVKRV